MITFTTEDETSVAYNLIYQPFLEVFEADKSNIWGYAFFKIFRTAIIADTLYKEGGKKVLENDDAKNQFLSLLFESYIFYVRIVYDLSTDIIQQHSNGAVKKSFNGFLKSVKGGKIENLDENLQKYVDRYSDRFGELKDIRDSLKRNSTADVYVKEETFFVFLKYYDKKGNTHKVLDTELSKVVLEQSILLCLLGVYLKKMIVK